MKHFLFSLCLLLSFSCPCVTHSLAVPFAGPGPHRSAAAGTLQNRRPKPSSPKAPRSLFAAYNANNSARKVTAAEDRARSPHHVAASHPRLHLHHSAVDDAAAVQL
jgi:hypothetical protein